jgi:hypothetical protein
VLRGAQVESRSWISESAVEFPAIDRDAVADEGREKVSRNENGSEISESRAKNPKKSEIETKCRAESKKLFKSEPQRAIWISQHPPKVGLPISATTTTLACPKSHAKSATRLATMSDFKWVCPGSLSLLITHRDLGNESRWSNLAIVRRLAPLSQAPETDGTAAATIAFIAVIGTSFELWLGQREQAKRATSV